MRTVATLRQEVDQALAEGRAADAVCALAEIVGRTPSDRHARTALAIGLGDAGFPAGALKVLRTLADRLAHDGFLLPAMVVVRHGLNHAPNDPSLLSTLGRLHVRGRRAKAGDLHVPPPLDANESDAAQTQTSKALHALPLPERLQKITELGSDLGPLGPAAVPVPLPLFSELDEEAFIETVRHLRYRRVSQGSELLIEGQPGDTLLVIASGHVNIAKGGKTLAKVGPGTVLGEMALITGAPRSATAIAAEEVEFFELSRADVKEMSQETPSIAEELMVYCRKRLIGNLLRSSPLFRKFDEDTRYALLDRFERRGFTANQPIIREGQNGDGLYVIATGEVQVFVDGDDGPVVVATLHPGDVFGEISLLRDQPTNATVTAHGRVGALFLPKAEFQAVVDDHPEVHGFLSGLSDDRIKASENAVQAEEILDADDLIVL